MNNEELKKKICKIIADNYLPKEMPDRLEDYKLYRFARAADALIAAGLKFDTVISHTATFDLAQQEQINRLERDNAALRERLEKAIELPCKVGDIVYCVEDEDGDYIVKPTAVTKKNIYLLCSRIKGNPSNAFLLQKAAEEWCKELKGGE